MAMLHHLASIAASHRRHTRCDLHPPISARASSSSCMHLHLSSSGSLWHHPPSAQPMPPTNSGTNHSAVVTDLVTDWRVPRFWALSPQLVQRADVAFRACASGETLTHFLPHPPPGGLASPLSVCLCLRLDSGLRRG